MNRLMQASDLKRFLSLFLQGVVVTLALGALAFLLWEPHVEGRNAHATLYQIYFKDPFLAYAYIASIPFFMALYQTFKVLGYAGQNREISQVTVDALRAIKHCAIAILGFVAGGVVFIILFGDKEDRPAGIFMSFLVTVAASVIATLAAMFARNLQNALRRSEGSRG